MKVHFNGTLIILMAASISCNRRRRKVIPEKQKEERVGKLGQLAGIAATTLMLRDMYDGVFGKPGVPEHCQDSHFVNPIIEDNLRGVFNEINPGSMESYSYFSNIEKATEEYTQLKLPTQAQIAGNQFKPSIHLPNSERIFPNESIPAIINTENTNEISGSFFSNLRNRIFPKRANSQPQNTESFSKTYEFGSARNFNVSNIFNFQNLFWATKILLKVFVVNAVILYCLHKVAFWKDTYPKFNYWQKILFWIVLMSVELIYVFEFIRTLNLKIFLKELIF